MNKVEHIAAMLGDGGKTQIAEMCEITKCLVSRWVSQGRIPAKYNMRMKRGLVSYAAKNGCDDSWLASAVSLLERDECPTCGKPMHEVK